MDESPYCKQYVGDWQGSDKGVKKAGAQALTQEREKVIYVQVKGRLVESLPSTAPLSPTTRRKHSNDFHAGEVSSCMCRLCQMGVNKPSVCVCTCGPTVFSAAPVGPWES